MSASSKQKGSGQSTKTAPTSRFSREPTKLLEGKSFYLHLLSRNVNTKNLDKRLRNLGGVVERFLSKDVTCVVTDQLQGKSRANASTVPLIQPKVQTRAQLMLQKATKQRTTSSTDVLRNARLWKIDVKPVGQVLKWLASQENRLSRDQEKSQGKVRALKGAFIKVEDRSRKYRPLLKEMTTWPRLNLDAPPGCSPFDEPVAMRTRSHSPKSPRKTQQRILAKPKADEGTKRRPPKRGYCELCDVTYEELRSHVNSKLHQAGAAKAGSFAGVDRLIQRGRSLREFVADVRARKAPSALKSSTVSQTAARLRRSGKANDPGKPRVTPLKSVRFAESNKVSVKRRKWTRHSPDNRQSSGRPSKRRRRESYAVIQATATTVRLRRRRRARPTSSK